MASSSLITELFEKSGNLDKNNIDSTFNKIQGRVFDIRSKLCEKIKEKHGDDLPQWLVAAEKLTKKIQQQAADIDQDSDRLKSVLKDFGEAWNGDRVKKIKEDLSETEVELSKLRKFVDVHDLLEGIDSVEEDRKRDYARRAELLSNLDVAARELLSSAESEAPVEYEGESFTIKKPVLKNLRDELVVRRERLTYDLYEEWSDAFRWTVDADARDTRFSIRINSTNFENLLTAWDRMDLLSKKTQNLGSNLLNYLFKPLLVDANARLEIVDKKDSNETENHVKKTDFVLTTHSQPADKIKTRTSDEILNDCHAIFENLRTILQATIPQKNVLFSRYLIENFVSKPFKEMVVAHILKPAVPAEISEMQKFEKLLRSCDALLTRLKSVGMLPEDQSTFEQFAGNVDVLFLDKRCQSILARARQFITADLHNTNEVGEEKNSKNEMESSGALAALLEKMNVGQDVDEAKTTKAKMQLRFDSENEIPPPLTFSKCRISASVEHLLQLIVQTLDEAASSFKPLTAGRLFYCSRNVMELYLDVAPVFHGQALETVTQTAAIFYNNCYYLAHHLSTLGYVYAPKLLPVLGVPSDIFAVTFIDFVPRLKELAEETMESQVHMQTRYILESLKPAEGFTNISEAGPKDVCRKALKACSLQFQHVHRVWKEVLSPTVLLRMQARIANELLNHVFMFVVGMEDMAADDAQIMHSLFGELFEDLQKYFVVENVGYMHRYCDTVYYKFKELLFVLNASLAEIDGRWASGNGPLANWLSAAQMKKLIRALFQNTEKRASVLSKIK